MLKSALLNLVILQITFMAFTSNAASDDDGQCNLYQVCSVHSDLQYGEFPTTPCYNGADVTYPLFNNTNDEEATVTSFPPQVMNDIGWSDLQSACPFYTRDDKLCCNSDTAKIMGKSFQTTTP